MARLRKKMQAAGTTGSAEGIPTFPARWFCGLYALFPGTGSLAPVARNARHEHRELGISTGMPGPHDFAVHDNTRSSNAASTSIAARLHVRDDAYAPSTRRDAHRKP